jgi:hypothetical protein
MPLTPEEERQLEYLLRKKYGGSTASNAEAPVTEHTEPPHAQPAEESAKVHGDKLEFESEA